MADKRTFDAQFSTEPEATGVENFETGSFGNDQRLNGGTDSSVNSDLEMLNRMNDPLKISDNGNRPQDESFKVFTPQLTGLLISDTILYSAERLALKRLITKQERNEPVNKEKGELEILNFFNQVNTPWSYQDAVTEREKNKERDFYTKNSYDTLPQEVVGRVMIKEESKNWYKIEFGSTEGFIEKKQIQINTTDWLKKSHQKETGDETIKSEKKKELDERLKKEETKKISEEQKKSKQSEYKNKLIELSKLNRRIASDEKLLKEVKEEFEKNLKKKKGDKEKVDKVISKFTEEILLLTQELKKNIRTYNETNQFIKREREKLLTEEEKSIVKEYKIKILDERENKKTDHLNPEEIIKDIENKVLMDSDAFKHYQEGKKQQKINQLEKKLENQELEETEKEKIQHEIKKINNPAPTTKPEDIARREIRLLAESDTPMKKSAEEEKALLYYLMKVSELDKDEKRGLYNYMITNLKLDSDINKVFGYDGDKIHPETFSNKFPDLAFTLPSDLIREKLSENKKAFKKDKKALRKKKYSFTERRDRKRKLKSDFLESKNEIKAPQKSIREKSGRIKNEFKSDKKKLKKEELPKKDYKSKLGERKDEFKNSRRDLREEKRENPGFLRGLWQKSRKDTAYNSILERLGYMSANRKENQGNIKRVRDNQSKKKSDLSLRTADEQTLMFFGLLYANKDFYLNAYELEYLRRIEGDSEKVMAKAIRFYEAYFKGRPNLNFGILGNAKYDDDVSQFYEKVVLPGLLFTAFPPKYYQNGVPSKPSEVRDDELRFWHKDYFDRLEHKSESLQGASKFTSQIAGGISNTPNDKFNLSWGQFTQNHPVNYWEAYDLQKQLQDESLSIDKKQQQLYEFYKLYESNFGSNSFATKEELWETWKGNPTQFFTQIFPKEYVSDGKLVSPVKIYQDFFEVLKSAVLETVKKESGIESIGDYAGERAKEHFEKNYLAYGIPPLLGLIGSDIFSKDSNVFKSVPQELGLLPSYFTAFVPINKTLIDYNRTTALGENQNSIQHKLRFSNQPFGKNGIVPTYPNVPGRSGELKPQDPNNPSNYQQMFTTDPKKTALGLYTALHYNLSTSSQKNAKTQNATRLSGTAFAHLTPSIQKKIDERTENEPQTYSLISQMYPLIQQKTYATFDYKQPWSMASLTGREKTDTFLNSIPDSPMFNYGFGLSYDQKFAKKFGISTALNYAGVNAFSTMNKFNQLNLWSGKFGTSFNADLKKYWKLTSNVNYNFAYTPDLTPDPNATNQDALKGIGQQHVLSGNLTIGNDFCEFSGAFTNDLMKGEGASTYKFKFSLNQLADIPKGTFSAQVMVEKRPAINSMQIPSMWIIGGGLVFQLGNILPNQPK